jgi:two-component system sensor histidine kinase YesM
MKGIIELIRNMKLKNKTALLSIFLVVFSTFLTTLFFYRYVEYLTRENAYVNSSEITTQAGHFMDEKLKDIIRRVATLTINSDFNKSLSRFLFTDDPYSHALTLTRFSGAFSEIRSLEGFIASVYLHTPKGDFYDLSRIPKRGFQFKSSRLFRQYQNQSGNPILWGVHGTDEIYLENKRVVPLTIPFSVDGYNGDILFVVNLDEQAVLDYFSSIYSRSDGNWILILDKRGRQVVAGDDAIYAKFMTDPATVRAISSGPQGSFQRRYGTESYLISYREMGVAPWKIISFKSEKVLLRKLNRIGVYIAILTIPSLVISLIFALFLSKSITQPLASLEKTIHKVTRRDFEVKFDYDYKDEVGQLGQSFNFMVGEIKELIGRLNSSIRELRAEKEKVKTEQSLKRRAELKALQAQINPHFLYNTLDSIHWMADKIGAGDISRMTTALATMFRTGLNKGKEFIPIRDELENVRSYLVIQKMRYGNKFDYRIDFAPDLLSLMTIKLILQPIVENAIYHGIKEKEGAGSLEITGRRVNSDRDIEIHIKDDGIGINPMKLELLNRRFESGAANEGEGYGIFNVNERIRLYLGREYGLKFYSKPGEGVDVRILIPVIGKEETDRYV